MSLIRPRYYLIFLTALSVCSFSPVAGNDFIANYHMQTNKYKYHVDHFTDTKAAYNAACTSNPIYEVLHAWVGVDDSEHANESDYRDLTWMFDHHVKQTGKLNLRASAMNALLLGGNKDYAKGKHPSYGIVYRDAQGVHFRRFAVDSGAALPGITSHYGDKNDRGWHSYYTSDQLEETDRGLVTYTCKTHKDNNICLSDLHQAGRWRNHDHIFKKDNWVQRLVVGGWDGQRSRLSRNSVPYFDYGHNRQKSMERGNGELLRSIHDGPHRLTYNEWKNRPANFWFAYDHGYFLFGEGTPTNEDELSNVLVEYPEEVPATPPLLWLRYFALHGPGEYSNVTSRYLNPKKKFRTPPNLRGKYPFWREVWKAETPGSFSLKFKARGSSVSVALNDTMPISSGSTGSNMDVGAVQYRIVTLGTGRTMIFGKNHAELLDTNKAYDDDSRQIFQKKGIGGGDKSTYYDYWLTLDENILRFGHGREIGVNTICQYNNVGIDEHAGTGTQYFTFSSWADDVDYIDITPGVYNTAYTIEPTNGQFSGWNSRRTLPEDDLGAITFKARNTAGTAKTIALGFSKDLPTATSGATYSVGWGDLSNSAGIIRKLGVPVDQKQHSLPEDSNEWGEYWVKYSYGNISYGSGTELDRNIISSWTDNSSVDGIKYFGFGSSDNTIEVSHIRAHQIDSHSTYDADPPGMGTYKKWLSSWSFTNDNQGAVSFTVKPPADSLDVMAQVGFTIAGNDAPGAAAYDLFIGKKDGDSHKVVLSKLGVEKASATLTGDAIPNAAGGTYWVAWYDERVFVGFGGEVGDLSRTILTYDTSTDASATAPPLIKRFSFTSGTGIISYRNIRSHPFSMVKGRIDAQEETANAETETIKQWHNHPTTRTIEAAYARRFYWHPQHRFTKDEPNASVTFTIKKPVFAEKAMPLIALGDAPAPTTSDGTTTLMAEEDYAGAIYAVSLRPEGTVQIFKKGATSLESLATSPVIDKVKGLNDGQSHNVWLNYENGTFKLGIDTSIGVEPVWEHIDATAPTNIRFASFGTGGSVPATDYVAGQAPAAGQAAKIELTNIAISDHYDPTKFLTPSAEAALHYQWRQDWKLPYPNNGGMTFTMKPHGNSTSSVMGAIGFGPDTLPANQPVKYAGALYNVLFYANGRVQATKAGASTGALGRASGVTKVKDALTDGQEHNWWITFADRTIMLGVDSAPGVEPMWSWTDPIKQSAETDAVLQRSVQHFSFSSSNGQLLLTNIRVPQQEATKSLSNEMLNFEDLLISNPSALFSRLDQLMMEQVHKQNITGFIGTLNMIGRARELIPLQSRKQLIQLIGDTLGEPGLSTSQQGMLNDTKVLLESNPTTEELADQYLKDLGDLSILSLEQTDPVRKLFMYKLARLTDPLKVRPEAFHVALDPFNRENSDKLGTLLNALSPELITDEPQKIQEDMRFSTEEQKILLDLALRIKKERETLWSATTSYRLEMIKEIAGTGARLLNIRNLIDAKRNDTENRIDFKDSDYALLFSLLRSIVENRWQLPATRILFLQRTLKAAQYMPGVHDNDGRKTQVAEMAADAITTLDFAARLESAKELLVMYEAATSTNPGRMDFFKEALPRIFDGELVVEQGKTLDDYFKPVVTDIIMPLRSGPLSEDEEKALVSVVQIMERRKSEFNQFAARLIRAQEKSESLFDYSQALMAILQDKDEIIQFNEPDYNSFVAALYDVVMNRELLVTAHHPSVQMLIEKTAFTNGFDGTKKYLVGPAKGTEVTLPQMKEMITEPYNFAARIGYATQLTQQLITRPAVKDEEDNTISDPLMRRMIAKLNIIKDAPNESTSTETEKLFEKLDRDVFMFLLSSNRVAEDDRVQLQRIHNMITDEKETLIANQKMFSYNFERAQKLSGSPSAYIKELRRIMDGIRRKTITFIDGEQDIIRDEISRLLDIRDEFSAADKTNMRQLIRAVRYSELSKAIPELTELETKLDLENAFQYADLVTRYAIEAKDAPHLPVNNGIEDETDADEHLRARFFAKLDKLLNAPGEHTPESLKAHLEMLEQLSEAPLEPHELQLVDMQKIRVAEEMKSQDTVSYRLAAADKNSDTFFEYAQALDDIMKDKDDPLIFAAGDYQSFSNALAYLVGNRETLGEEQRTFVRSILDPILTQYEDSQGNPIKEEYAPELFSLEFGPHAMKLFMQREKLATAHTMRHRVVYAEAELRAFKKQKLTPDHARFQRFMEKVSVITNAPGIKEKSEFSRLKMMYESLQRYLERNEHDASRVIEWLDALPARETEALTRQMDFSYQFKQAKDQKELGGVGPYITELREIALRKQNGEVTFKPADFIVFYEALEQLTNIRDSLSRTEWYVLRQTVNTASTKSFSPDEQMRNDFIALNEQVKTLPDFNDKVLEYLEELEDIKGAGTKSEARATFYKKLSNVARLPGYKEVERIDDLVRIAEELLPFAATPTEKQTLNTLTMVILKEKITATTLPYHLAKVSRDVSEAREKGDDHLGILIKGLNDIIDKKRNGHIVLTAADPKVLVEKCETLLLNREILEVDQIQNVQDICADFQDTSGFEEFDTKLEEIKKKIGEPQTLEERLIKYERQARKISALPMNEVVNIAAKEEFVSMVRTIMEAPGDRTESILERLDSLVKRIQRGNFTEEQQGSLTSLSAAIAEEEKQISSFSYRIKRIGQSPAPLSYYNAIETLIDNVATGEVTMTAAERLSFITLLEEEAKKRPLIADVGNPLLVIIDKTKITEGFVDKEDTLVTLAQTIKTDASLTDRVTAISRQLPTLLRREKDDGERRRFFVELETFTNNLGMLPSERLTLDKKETIANATSIIARYKSSANATASEKELIAGAVSQLGEISKKIDTAEEQRIIAAAKAEEERVAAEKVAEEKARREADIRRQAADKAIRREKLISSSKVKTNLVGFQRSRVHRRRRRKPVTV